MSQSGGGYSGSWGNEGRRLVGQPVIKSCSRRRGDGRRQFSGVLFQASGGPVNPKSLLVHPRNDVEVHVHDCLMGGRPVVLKNVV